MLNRVVAILATSLLLAGLPLASAAAADGDGGVSCPPDEPICIIEVHDPGDPGSGGSPGGSAPGTRVCKVASSGEIVPCYDANWGWWSNTDSCYYQRLDPPPPADATVWKGHYPDGAIYASTCIGGAGGTGGGWLWLNTPPEGYGGTTPTPAQLAQQAVDTMRLDGPAIGMAPPGGKTGLLHEDKSIPESRGCPTGYSIGAVQTFSGQSLSAYAVLIAGEYGVREITALVPLAFVAAAAFATWPRVRDPGGGGQRTRGHEPHEGKCLVHRRPQGSQLALEVV